MPPTPIHNTPCATHAFGAATTPPPFPTPTLLHILEPFPESVGVAWWVRVVVLRVVIGGGGGWRKDVVGGWARGI